MPATIENNENHKRGRYLLQLLASSSKSKDAFLNYPAYTLYLCRCCVSKLPWRLQPWRPRRICSWRFRRGKRWFPWTVISSPSSPSSAATTATKHRRQSTTSSPNNTWNPSSHPNSNITSLPIRTSGRIALHHPTLLRNQCRRSIRTQLQDTYAISYFLCEMYANKLSASRPGTSPADFGAVCAAGGTTANCCSIPVVGYHVLHFRNCALLIGNSLGKVFFA